MSGSAELGIKSNTGQHAITAYVDIPESEEQSVLEWSGNDVTALHDILLLLSIFLGRDIFLDYSEDNDKDEKVILADPRVYRYGDVLRCSIPFKKEELDQVELRHSFREVGFEEVIDRIYRLIRNELWRDEYQNGYFLFLARDAFRRQSLESSFIQCWTVWEHLFAALNRKWLSKDQIKQISSAEKISFLLVKYALKGEIDNTSRTRIQSLSEIRNKLIHFGRFPERDKVNEEADLFVRLTEFVIAKILELSPSNVFNTVEKLEDFLSEIKST